MCVQRVSAQCVLQFTPSLAAGCVLHRPENRVIHHLESCHFFFSFSISTYKHNTKKRPEYPIPSRKRQLISSTPFNASKALIEEVGIKEKGRCAFCNPRIVPVHFKVSRNRGSRGSPLGASSKGTEATLLETAHPNHRGFFCTVPTAYKLGRVGARLHGFSTEIHEGLRMRQSGNDPSAGSPTETLLRLLLPLNDQVWSSFQHTGATERPLRVSVRRPH
ncbi:unnamed protein product [Ixodes hexagonus]